MYMLIRFFASQRLEINECNCLLLFCCFFAVCICCFLLTLFCCYVFSILHLHFLGVFLVLWILLSDAFAEEKCCIVIELWLWWVISTVRPLCLLLVALKRVCIHVVCSLSLL